MGRTSRFAWQGISLALGDDWRPAALTGSFREGYARLEGEREAIIQIRWKKSKPVKGLNRRVLAYFSQLERTARKGKGDFTSELKILSDGAVEYHWHAGAKAYGKMWYDDAFGRVMFLERSGRNSDSFKREARDLFEAVQIHSGERRPWCLIGLSISLPSAYQLQSYKLLSGRTTLQFRRRGARLTAERWAFASQLLAKHGFGEWAISATGIKADPEIEGSKIKLTHGKRTALVMCDAARNQLVVLNAVHSRGLEPKWDYFD